MLSNLKIKFRSAQHLGNENIILDNIINNLKDGGPLNTFIINVPSPMYNIDVSRIINDLKRRIDDLGVYKVVTSVHETIFAKVDTNQDKNPLTKQNKIPLSEIAYHVEIEWSNTF